MHDKKGVYKSVTNIFQGFIKVTCQLIASVLLNEKNFFNNLLQNIFKGYAYILDSFYNFVNENVCTPCAIMYSAIHDTIKKTTTLMHYVMQILQSYEFFGSCKFLKGDW